ncbi:hypothetical protein GG344DRAFT_81858 [Lentinula edodes]|nr:hypothetical protein GG344DRAFT_81858 [Lentinula edodes]
MAFLVSILNLSFEFSTLLLFILVAPQYIDGSSLEVPTSDNPPNPALRLSASLVEDPNAKVDEFKGARFAVEGNNAGNGVEAEVSFQNMVNLGASISQAPRLPCLHEAAEESLQEGGGSRLELT